MRWKNKKGMMSLEALIILIAMIVIAALSAGIIIRNSGVLQQRAVTVSEQSRERLVTGLEVISMTGDADIASETINDMEILVRLKAGSLPIQMKNLKILFTTQDVSASASLQENTMNDKFDDIDLSSLNSSWMQIPDIEGTDFETITTNSEMIRYDSAGQQIEVNLSYFSNNADPDDEDNVVPGIATIPVDLSSPGTVDVRDAPIEINGVKYGFISIVGTTTTADTLEGMSGEAVLTNFPIYDTACKFDNLIAERRFCVVSRIGNGDSTLNTGEIVALRFSFKPYNLLPIETSYELQLLPKEGAIETLSAITPSTLVVEKTKLWG